MQLDHEQQMGLEAMLAGKNVFLTGRAGTGKSTVINEFIRHNLPNLVCVAPTGMAARNLDHAQTLHRCFNLQIGIAYPPLPAYLEHDRADLLRTIKTVLIDEISMVRSDVFMAVDCLLRRYASDNKQHLPFGGRQMIVVGDFFQLPPVATRDEQEEYLEDQFDGIYAFNTPAWQEAAFGKIELTQIYRQTDPEYIEFLNEIRNCGPGLADWLKHANQRVWQGFIAAVESATMCLCCRKLEANAINAWAMAQLADPGIVLEGHRHGYFPEEELPVAWNLLIKHGAKVMLQGNLSPLPGPAHYRYVNGDIGTVLDYDASSKSVVVQLEHGPVVTVKPASWDNYEYTTWRDEDGSLQIRQEIVGTFRQLPLAPAYATTIHKAQGQTLGKVHLVLGNGCFAPGQLYTALSRVRSFADLTLDRPIRLSEAFCDAMVLDFINRP